MLYRTLSNCSDTAGFLSSTILNDYNKTFITHGYGKKGKKIKINPLTQGKRQLKALLKKIPQIQRVISTFYDKIGLYDINGFIKLLNSRLIDLAKLCNLKINTEQLLTPLIEKASYKNNRTLGELISKTRTRELSKYFAANTSKDWSSKLLGICAFDNHCSLLSFADLYKIDRQSATGQLIIREYVKNKLKHTNINPSAIITFASNLLNLSPTLLNSSYPHKNALQVKVRTKKLSKNSSKRIREYDIKFVSALANVIDGLLQTSFDNWQEFTTTKFINLFENLVKANKKISSYYAIKTIDITPSIIYMIDNAKLFKDLMIVYSKCRDFGYDQRIIFKLMKYHNKNLSYILTSFYFKKEELKLLLQVAPLLNQVKFNSYSNIKNLRLCKSKNKIIEVLILFQKSKSMKNQ